MVLEDVFEEVNKLLERYPEKEAALLPTLHLVQRSEGYISDEAIKSVASHLEIPQVRVEKAISFYTIFRRIPIGQHLIEICTNISCSLLGADHLLDYLEKELGIKAGETTSDGLFTLGTVECLGACGVAPVMQVDDDYYGNLTEEKISQIISDFREKESE